MGGLEEDLAYRGRPPPANDLSLPAAD